MAKQEEFGGEEFEGTKTPLGKAAKAFVECKNEMEEAHLKLEKFGEKVLDEMKKVGKKTLKLVIDGERFIFSTAETKEKLVVKKDSKTPKVKEDI